MGPRTIGARSLIKAASSDERDLAPGLTPPTVASERQGTVSNMHLNRKKKDISKSFICANFLLPAGGAMTISGYWHVDIFRKAL